VDTETLVEGKIDDGQRLLVRLVRGGLDIALACWIMSGEDGRWYLYVVSNSVEAQGLTASYGQVVSALPPMSSPWVSLSEVKLIGPNSPVARGLAAVFGKHLGRVPAPPHHPQLGGLAIEEAYVYPPVTKEMTREEVLSAVASLMSRSGLVRPALVTFRDGSAIRATPTGVEVPHPGDVEVRFVDAATQAARTVKADEVASIQ
jgi:hypothetical protein